VYIDLPLRLSNACLHLKDCFITWYLSRLGRVEQEGVEFCINKGSFISFPAPPTY